MPARRRRILIGLTAAVGAVAIAAVTVIALRPGGGTAPEEWPAAAATSSVCGFEGPLVHRISTDRPAGGAEPLASWPIDGDGALNGLEALGDRVLLSRSRDGISEFLRYTPDGELSDRFDIGFDHGGRWTLADDGSIFAIDVTGEAVVRLSPSGDRLDSFALDRASEVARIVWVPQYQGAPALLIDEEENAALAVRPSGELMGRVAGLPDELLGLAGSGVVTGLTRASDGSDTVVSIDAVDLGSGSARLHAVFSPDTTTVTAATPAPERLASVVRGPEGEGFLLGTAFGVQWVDELGIGRAMWLAGEGGLAPADPAVLAEHDGRYWALVHDEGRERIASLTTEQMRARLNAPILLTSNLERVAAQLGLGLGAITRAAFNHFDAGEEPAVLLRAEPGWGELPGAERPELELRYTVAGDPTLAEPIRTEPQRVEIPWGGGEIPLQLPPTRPGAYEVSLTLVDAGSGTVLAGSCLRYSVGSALAPLRLDELARGDDWGGAAPLRGTQLAAALGIGSHRVQLDFGAMVPDPEANPDPELIEWWAVPGAGLSDGPDEDPFQDLRAAASFAASHGVRIIVQVGSAGAAEWAAIEAGTWAGWNRLIVARFAQEAPGITAWAAFNEPNAAFDSADDYWTAVEIPFADAAHAASPDAEVIAGNTLGFDPGWWARAEPNGVCSRVDAIGVHPYTGWNRSWEEEGFIVEGEGYDELVQALGPACAALPLWDTESGWTADGAVAAWAQGSNVARKLLWYQHEGIAGWTYFFSEGGWGENGLSWSLIQYRSHVKPGGLAFATVSRLLEGRGRPELVPTGIPFIHAMRIPGDDTMLAVWTDEARLTATLHAPGSTVDVIDEYGGERTITLSNGTAEVVLTATPQFFRAPAGSDLTLAPVETFGTDLLVGRPVSATSTHFEADPQVITSGTVDPYRPWRSGTLDGGVDPLPAVTIPLAQATTIDRIAVATGSIVCCEAGLRSYTVSVQRPDGTWQDVAAPVDQFWERTVLFRFDPVEAVAVRVSARWTTIRDVEVLDMNYTGFAGGLPPPFMGLQTATDYVMSLSAVSAWAPGSVP